LEDKKTQTRKIMLPNQSTSSSITVNNETVEQCNVFPVAMHGRREKLDLKVTQHFRNPKTKERGTMTSLKMGEGKDQNPSYLAMSQI